jgi:hypothetical protein
MSSSSSRTSSSSASRLPPLSNWIRALNHHGCDTGLRLIIQGVDPAVLEAAFRQHASSISVPTPSDGLSAIAVDGKTLRGSFDAFSDRKAAHMMSALRQADQIVLGGRGEEQRGSGRARADRGPRPEGLCVHARRRTRLKKSFERAIASGNHLLTQVKDNQPWE